MTVSWPKKVTTKHFITCNTRERIFPYRHRFWGITINDTMTRLARFRHRANSVGIICIVLCCFFIPFSTALMGATASLAVVCWLLSAEIIRLPETIKAHPSASLALILMLLLAGAVLYSAAPTNEALSVLKKYRELLYFVMVLSLFRDNEGAARLAEDAFIAGCIVLLLVSYGIYFELLPPGKFGHSLVYHITHSLFMAMLAFWSLHRALDARGTTLLLWLSIFTLATINLFYIAPGRTGMLLYITLITLTLVQRLSWKKWLPATLLVAVGIAITFTTSSNFSTRVHEALQEIQTYQADSSRTSLGMRFDWWSNSLQLIAEKPLLGHGTGSFQVVQEDLIRGSETKSTDNPHNEYLFLGVQAGLVATILFVALMISQLLASYRLPPPKKNLLQGVVAAMAVGCLMNSFLFDSHPGHFYAILSAILAVSVRPSKVISVRES